MLKTLQRHQRGLLVASFLGLMTFLALDNLILHLGTAIPASDLPYKDYVIPYWSLWWVKYALVHLHTNPMLTNYVLFPNMVNLSLHSHIFTLGLFALPLQSLMDMHWIVNGLIVLSFLLSSTLMFIFLHRHMHNIWLSILGATLYAFSPSILWRATQVHLSTLPVWWFPLNLLLWDKTLERRSIRWSLALGICIYLAFMNYSESILWMLLTLPPYMLYGLFTQASARARWQVIGLGFVAATAALAPTLVMPLPQIQQVQWNEYAWEDLRTVHSFSFPLAALFTRSEVGENSTLGQTLPVLVLVSLMLTGKRRQRWLWLSAGLVSFTLALGPYLNTPSQPLPFMLIYNLTHGQYRTPVRLVTPMTLALVMFVTYSLANLFDRMRNQRAQALITALTLVIYVIDVGILAPFPIQTVPDYPVYHLIGRDPEDHTLLQVPLGPSTTINKPGDIYHPDASQLTFYARFHHQRTINGLVSRVPAGQLERYRRSPLLLALARESPLPPFEEARAELVRRLKSWDIRYIVVHKDLLKPEEVRSFTEFFNQQPELCVFYDDAVTMAFRAISKWADCPRPDLTMLPPDGKLDMGQAGDQRFVGLGWYDVENVGGPQARWAGEIATSTLRLVLPPQDTRIRFRAMAYPTNQTVAISVNSQPVATINMTGDWAEHEFTVPADALRADGPSVITLAHARLESPFERTGGASPDKRLLAAAYDYFDFAPASR